MASAESLSIECAPLVSVCIANYNGEKLLYDCIDSVLAQGLGEKVEIIVHDDASTDASLVLLRASYPHVRVIESSENVGFCISNNRMAKVANGRFLLLLNNDAALMPDAFSSLLAEQANVGRPCILTLPQYDWESGALVDRGCLLDPFYNPIPNLDPSRRDVAYVIGACLWIEKDLWNELGGFPEWMESIAEDIYICCVARLLGFPTKVTVNSGFKHKLGTSFGGARVVAGNLATTIRRRRLSERNKTFALITLTPTVLAWPLLLVHSAALMAEGLLLCISLRSMSVLQEIYVALPVSIWRKRRVLASTRRLIQSNRKISITDYLSQFSLLPRKLALLLKHGIPSIKS